MNLKSFEHFSNKRVREKERENLEKTLHEVICQIVAPFHVNGWCRFQNLQALNLNQSVAIMKKKIW
jgi:polyphosphate kinase